MVGLLHTGLVVRLVRSVSTLLMGLVVSLTRATKVLDRLDWTRRLVVIETSLEAKAVLLLLLISETASDTHRLVVRILRLCFLEVELLSRVDHHR